MSLPTTFTLNTGAKIPTVALGTYDANEEDGYKAILLAIQKGYRHIDTAKHYNNEGPVGRAIRDSGVPREEFFVVTKAWPTQFRDVAAALDSSLEKLGLDYVDLYLQHWPQAKKPDPNDPKSAGLEDDTEISYVQVWEQFQNLPKEKARAIGVSNYTTTKLKTLLAAPTTKIVPAVNQVELHPGLPQKKLIEYLKANQIIPEAYTPLAKGEVNDPVVVKIAKKHNADPGQIVLSWNVQRGVVVLPKSVTPSRLESNIKTVKLDEDDLKEIDKLGETPHRLIVPGFYDHDVFENNIDS